MARLGIIAGGGTLPLRLVEACRQRGEDVFVLAFKGQTKPETLKDVPHSWVVLGQTDAAIKALKENSVDRVVMAGGIRRPSFFELKPDVRTIKVFARLGTAGLGDDALLRAVRMEFEKDGIRVIGAHEVDESLLTPSGVLTETTPDQQAQTDIDYGIRVTQTLGELDVGQAAVVQQGIVLGVEAVEGTDALLQRCKGLRRKGIGGVLVKTKKPQQDKNLDLPAIGPRTVRKVYEAGLRGIAVQSENSLVLERDEVIRMANKLGLFVTGVDVS